jgi:hypothetical protein
LVTKSNSDLELQQAYSTIDCTLNCPIGANRGSNIQFNYTKKLGLKAKKSIYKVLMSNFDIKLIMKIELGYQSLQT